MTRATSATAVGSGKGPARVSRPQITRAQNDACTREDDSLFSYQVTRHKTPANQHLGATLGPSL